MDNEKLTLKTRASPSTKLKRAANFVDVCQHNENLYLDSREPSFQNEVSDTFKLFVSRTEDLSNDAAGDSQISYIRGELLPRLTQYRNHIENSLHFRRAPRTWNNNHVVFLSQSCVYLSGALSKL